ncbi:GTP 3',8-cyclase MoaA [Ruminococcus sp. OA3]|uniref:GTP 3',8-cyclase MoaA n=1 Tax=Ruminococcus sp. OA3 TaxID=2914164 RepID=UPI001F06B973|nr:GTP 3',8-cyclase MoaA [Ruminococcus sp. OA3]MCH1982584.1 GTP 3',8-cyclase MoaA [Ruminococcus sp. OA3]
MIDQCGRNIDYVRISVTDRCNLRCVYCMPEDGVKNTPHEEILRYDEILRVCRIMAGLGISKIKLTGGEPLVRKDVPYLVRELKQISGIEKVTLTTNGILLTEYMKDLHAAGINGINISLDTMNPALFREITRRDMLDHVKCGIEAAMRYRDVPLKINCVPMGMEGQDLMEIAALAGEHPVHVRFIEMMPIGYGKKFKFIGEDEIVGQLRAAFGEVTPCMDKLGNGPGHYYTVEQLTGKIGFISAISHKFCNECNRIRMTSQGFLKSCLQYETGRDLRTLLRTGADDGDIEAAIREVVLKKPTGHEFLAEQISEEESHCMAQIGG